VRAVAIKTVIAILMRKWEWVLFEVDASGKHVVAALQALAAHGGHQSD
jgi:hypothetical protein